MSKKVIECEYCHTLISEDDVKCPECGANCTEAIKKYRQEQQEKIEKEERAKEEQNRETITFINNFFGRTERISKIISIVFLVIFLIVFVFIFLNFNNHKNKDDLINQNITDHNTNEENNVENEKVVVSYQEMAETKDMNVILDSYELYEYHSDSFESYNTRKGYQKIAFHFSIENVGDNSISTYSLFSLTADDSKVDSSKLEITQGFDKVVKGKEKYERIDTSVIESGQKLNGYVGYLVPKDKKTLKFYVGKNITIEMDNPAYSGN